jgi:hypothetical protein
MPFSFLLSLLLSLHTFQPPPVTAIRYPQEEITPQISRLTEHAGNEYTVTVTIKSDGIRGFVKYTDSIPPGAKATALELADGVFKSEGAAKFIWVSFPSSPVVVIRYKVVFDSFPVTNYKGTLRYVSNNIVREIVLAKKDISFVER